MYKSLYCFVSKIVKLSIIISITHMFTNLNIWKLHKIWKTAKAIYIWHSWQHPPWPLVRAPSLSRSNSKLISKIKILKILLHPYFISVQCSDVQKFFPRGECTCKFYFHNPFLNQTQVVRSCKWSTHPHNKQT